MSFAKYLEASLSLVHFTTNVALERPLVTVKTAVSIQMGFLSESKTQGRGL